MTLDATKPKNNNVSELETYMRETRAEVNSLAAGVAEFTFTELTVSAGATSLVIGTDLSAIDIEYIKINALGAAALDQITGGTEGQVKVLICQDNDLSLVDGAKNNGQFYLNQLPVGSTLNLQQDDIIALVNIDGDGDSEDGYWKELYRALSVK